MRNSRRERISVIDSMPGAKMRPHGAFSLVVEGHDKGAHKQIDPEPFSLVSEVVDIRLLSNEPHSLGPVGGDSPTIGGVGVVKLNGSAAVNELKVEIADRVFRSFLNSARAAGLNHAKALQVANRKAIAISGVDMLDELGITATCLNIQSGSELQAANGRVEGFCDDWLSGRLHLPATVCRSVDLYEAYLRWYRKSKEASPIPINRFFIKMAASATQLRKRHLSAIFNGRTMRVRCVVVGDQPTSALAVSAELSRFAAALAQFSGHDELKSEARKVRRAQRSSQA